MEFSQSHGFTLVEIILVILVLGIIGIYITARYPGDSIQLSMQAKALASDIQYTQNLAITHGYRYKLAQNGSSQYQIIQLSTGNPVIKTVNFESNITFSSFPYGQVVFDGKGIPYSNTTLPGTPLSQNLTIQITTAGITKSIIIAPETGRITL